MKTIETLSHQKFDLCGLGTCQCSTHHQANDVITVKNPSCGVACGVIPCTFGTTGNCENVIGANKTINIDACMCTQGMACNTTTDVFCLRRPGSGDPGTEDWGFLGETVSGKSTIHLDPNQSSLTTTVSFTDDVGIHHTDTRTATVTGEVNVFGLQRGDGTADLVFDIGLYASSFTFHYESQSREWQSAVAQATIRYM